MFLNAALTWYLESLLSSLLHCDSCLLFVSTRASPWPPLLTVLSDQIWTHLQLRSVKTPPSPPHPFWHGPSPSLRHRHRCIAPVLLAVPSAPTWPSTPGSAPFAGSIQCVSWLSFAANVVRAKQVTWMWPRPNIASQAAGSSCLSSSSCALQALPLIWFWAIHQICTSLWIVGWCCLGRCLCAAVTTCSILNLDQPSWAT